MLHNKIVVFVFSMFICANAFAFATEKSAYNVPNSMTYCLDMDIGNACVGNSLMSGGKCWYDNKDPMANRGTDSDEGAVLLFIAQKIKSTGAKFCLTQVQARNKNRKSPSWVEYFAASGNQHKCFWLCKSGYGGAECDEENGSSVCEFNTIKRSVFSGYKLTTSPTADYEDLSWLYGRAYDRCGTNTKEEHEMFLAISGWVPGGHGAMVAPMVARAKHWGWDKMDTAPFVYTVAESTLLCAPGYKPNPAKTDCEPIDEVLCQIQSSTFCTNFSRDKFDANIHTLDSSSPNNCLRYFCIDSNKAFPSAGNTSCEDCAVGVRGGARLSDGVCVKCDLGQVFNRETGTCEPALGLTRTDLQYGRGKTKSSQTELKDQCWLKISSEDYKECVLGPSSTQNSSTSNNTSGGSRFDTDRKYISQQELPGHSLMQYQSN